jgi:PTS system nitrogen regulatory IIA component
MFDLERNFSELLEQGGLHRDIEGTTPADVLSSLIKTLPPVPSAPAESLLKAVMEREALMPTSIGKGIALPHPRNHFIMEEKNQYVALAYLKNPVDWHSLDGIKVDSLLFIASASAKQHLQTLSRINYFCRQDDFLKLIRERSPFDTLLGFIRETEKKWI